MSSMSDEGKIKLKPRISPSSTFLHCYYADLREKSLKGVKPKTKNGLKGASERRSRKLSKDIKFSSQGCDVKGRRTGCLLTGSAVKVLNMELVPPNRETQRTRGLSSERLLN